MFSHLSKQNMFIMFADLGCVCFCLKCLQSCLCLQAGIHKGLKTVCFFKKRRPEMGFY
ncbi:hypothetical protein HanRHA438_Chr02g0050541 [Helianthus annuus]|nr:hypothetical protein HanHA300_Chr02g0040121 [Helianthus annuus]KAJ0613777.1 hypothetical protein HanIR_Chr02g0055141 [Helianthus annuus]KAJ0617564.1 hypothetical protein HanHA89_Chr02g0043231 [Helianthus annuus]KAJ0938502.1 hypothetical protein HanRHA438_Chr02g0050541 [Helianthus annuus]KAJ0950488.1 hypothetical protein HanPSC8_Chr02g0048851 [Helianthus annuus]